MQWVKEASQKCAKFFKLVLEQVYENLSIVAHPQGAIGTF
jgi:hypothetical protein